MVQQLTTTVLGREYTLDLSGTLTGYWLVFLRLLVGWLFLHEGLNKYATPGSFRAGWFLEKTGTIVSPVLNAFAGGATEAAVNVVIPIGELLIGFGLLLGALTRTAAFFGAFMMFFFYFGGEHWRRGLVNGDLLGLVLFVTILVFGAGRVWGIDSYLERTDLVQARPWLRYLLG
ncbi:DoxX family membrane protein [Haloarcula salina]|uniref:DoxX family membrane protein n=1 Tax=Haloarcula salina TaxID=1429914 RepID=UPI003C6EECA8